LIALACAFVGAPSAMASEFTVNSTADEVDATPGDESCLTLATKCTLRAAIEAANGLGESSTILFEEETFEGQAAATIVLNSSLPPITVPTSIGNGRRCPTAAGITGPCAGIEGQADETALIVSNAEEVSVFGLSVTGAQVAISLKGSPRAKIQESWFGVALDGTSAGNGTGILLGSGSNRAFIGGEGAGQGNVFADSAGDGLDVHGGNDTKVYGNYFGVAPDGVTPMPNGADDVEVVSTEGSEVVGTEIGTRVRPAAAASPQCDGGCNVISGAASNGVDLEGEGEDHAAVSTSVLGNYIGVGVGGTAAIPNAAAGVAVGEATGSVVGGPSSGEANCIDGGSVAVLAGPAAGDLSVRGNLIGTDVTGTGMLDPPDDGIVVNSGQLSSPMLEAEIAGNVIRMEDGTAIVQQGQGAWIFANRIFGSKIGIRTFESTEYGNVIEANLIEGPATNGILVENNLNEIVGNTVLGSGAAGIRIDGSSLPPFGVSGNRIGGDVAADENAVFKSGGAAIEIANFEATDNEVARNVGAGNGGLFIDLVAASPSTEVGPNRGIKPPTFSTLTQLGASGGAVKGATVRVFRKQLPSTGELDSFLGEAVADANGGWSVDYGEALPAGTFVAATQTKEGDTSELALGATPGSEGGGGGAGATPRGLGGVAAGTGLVRVRPQTRIVRARLHGRAIVFSFESDHAGSRFLCRLDDRPFDLCRSPKRYAGLRPGRHVFWVRTVDLAGRVDFSPAKRKFVVR
jgi:CSLREA domain-containing protein